MTKGHPRATIIPVAAFLAIMLIAAFPPISAKAEAPAALKQLNEASVQVAEKVTPAVVNITSTKKLVSGGPMGGDLDPQLKNHPFFDEFFKRFKKDPRFDGGGRPPQGMGSGVIVSPDGHILTNSHVVKDADEINVSLSDKRSFKAKVIGTDPESDIAVIKIDTNGLPIAKLGDSSKLRVGEYVMAVGNPFGLNRTVTSGIISATGRSNVNIIGYEDFIQTDAAINPGNSGGPLVNIDGEVIGINTAIATRSGGYQGVGFAIPSNSAKLIMDDLMKSGKVRRGLLGVNIQDVTESLAKSFARSDTEGALVSQVVPDSPAQKAGIKDGDIIVKFNGEPIKGAAHLKNLVGKEKPGATAKLTIFRDKKTLDVSVKIAERTEQAVASAAGPSQAETSNELGIEIEKVPVAMAEKLGLKEGEGVRVKDLDAEGAGSRMGLKSGDVILEVDGKPVSDGAAFNQAVSDAKKNKLIRLKVKRGSGSLYLSDALG